MPSTFFSTQLDLDSDLSSEGLSAASFWIIPLIGVGAIVIIFLALLCGAFKEQFNTPEERLPLLGTPTAA